MAPRTFACSLIVLLACGIGCATQPHPPLHVQRFEIPGTHAAAPLIVGTYNLHWLRDARNLRRDLDRLAGVNVWCFQEVRLGPDQSCATVLASILPPGEWHGVFVRTNPLPELPGEDSECQAIVSRLPISEPALWMLSPDGAGKRRLALVARVRGVRVVNTDHEPGFFSRKRNIAQAQALARHLAADPAPPTLVAGDFNCPGHLDEVNATLERAGFHDVAPAGVATFHAGPIRSTIDRIFVRGLVVTACTIDRSAAGSDHYPVVAEIQPP